MITGPLEDLPEWARPSIFQARMGRARKRNPPLERVSIVTSPPRPYDSMPTVSEHNLPNAFVRYLLRLKGKYIRFRRKLRL